MPEKAAKKIQRRNERRENNARVQRDAAEYGLGVNQVEHFLAMEISELQEVLTQSRKELSMLDALATSPAQAQKRREHDSRISYVEALIRRKR